MVHGIFSYQKSHFGYILERLGVKNVGIFCGQLKYFTAISDSLWHLIILSSFGLFFPALVYYISRKIWQPCFEASATGNVLEKWPKWFKNHRNYGKKF
jgi:hypothetical protein